MVFVKGHKKIAGREKGTPNKATLLQEERRAMFDARISQKWEEIIDQLRPEYIADQYLGKAQEKLDITSQGDKIMTGESEIALLAKEAAAILKENDTNSSTTGST